MGGPALPDKGGFSLVVAKYGPGGAHLWSNGYGTQMQKNTIGYTVGIDKLSNNDIIVAGSFEGHLDFGVGSSTSVNDTEDIFIVKLNSSGTPLWAKFFGGSGDDRAESVIIKNNGEIVVTGSFKNTVDFSNNGHNLTSASGTADVFLAKYDQNGNLRWARAISDQYEGYGYGIALDPNDNPVITGSFSGNADFGDGINKFASIRDIFLAKYLDQGTTSAHSWSKAIGNVGVVTLTNEGFGVAVESGGNIAITGSFKGIVNFAGDGSVIQNRLTSVGSEDIFVAKYEPDGDYIWARRFGGTDIDTGNDVAVDNSGKIVVSGSFSGTAEFNGENTTSNGVNDVFVLKLEP